MLNILLLEPGYKNKYPPLGLMKIATYHMQRNDNVIFAKGTIGTIEDRKLNVVWDRIYLTTLFTFEWSETKKTIEYALGLVSHPNKIYVGGIAATLLINFIKEQYPGINIVTGLLNENGKIGFDDDGIIDTLAPDYSILDQIKYPYPAANSFFAYTTRGCGMNCSFCAVKILEPVYEPRISIKQQINQIAHTYGKKKDLRNLLLMDNNVLKSPFLRDIVDEIKELGFAKDAKYINPETGKEVQRAIDFNQGLDANLLNPEKAQMLAELELRPVRIAFDHINDKTAYIRAMQNCVNAGLKEFSNYILYNSEDNSSWKGKNYSPDMPEDLYQRLFINIELQESFRKNRLDNGERVSIYSFPMRYIPLNQTSRGFIGTNWNAKFLRAVQVMLTPTQGKGVSGRGFFTAAFGSNIEEFMMNLVMPEKILAIRGKFVEKDGEPIEKRTERYTKWQFGQGLIEEWKYNFRKVNNKDQFISIISSNKFNYDIFKNITDSESKKLYLYYLTEQRLINLLSQIEKSDILLVREFLLGDGQALYKLLISYINSSSNLRFSLLKGYIRVFGHMNINAIVKKMAFPKILLSNQKKIDNVDEKAILDGLIFEWDSIYGKIKDIDNLLLIITKEMKTEDILSLKNSEIKKICLYYLTESQLLDLFNQINGEEDIIFFNQFLIRESSFLLNNLAHYIYQKQLQKHNIIGYIKLFGNDGLNILLKLWFDDSNKTEYIPGLLEKAFNTIRYSYTDIELLYIIKEFFELKVFGEAEQRKLRQMFIEQNYPKVRELLRDKFDLFRDRYLQNMPLDFTAQILRKVAEDRLKKLYELVC